MITSFTYADSAFADAKVLVLNSYHSQHAGAPKITGILDGLKDVVIDENIHIEHMDTRRHYDDHQYFQMLLEIYRHKFRKIEFDVIIAVDDNAFDFLKQHRELEFADVPVVFCAVNFFDETLDQPGRWFTGNVEGNGIRQNLELITRLHPEIREVLVLFDKTTLSEALKPIAQETFSSLANTGITFIIRDDFTYSELLDQAGALQSDTVIFLSLIAKDRDGRHFSYKEDFPVLCRTSTVPIYGMWGILNGKGAVGGYLNSQYHIGRNAAELAVQVLSGKDPSDIPIGQDPFEPEFDHTQLKRFGIDRNKLPAGSTIINQPFEVYFVHKKIVWSSIAFGLLLSGITVYLFIQIVLRKRAERERAKSISLLKNKNKELESIIYASSHDLRSPLINISGFSGELAATVKQITTAIQEEYAPGEIELLLDEVPDLLDVIVSNSKKMKILLDGLLAVCRTGQQVLKLSEVNVRELVSEIIKSMSYQIQENHVQIISNHLPNCLADQALLSQVFTNLIDNAIKFKHPERNPEIRIWGKAHRKEVRFCVEDNGIGIDPEHKKIIFEIFHRLNPNNPVPGLGLGLTILRRIIDLHNGEIWVDSDPGKGSRFYFNLPVNP